VRIAMADVRPFRAIRYDVAKVGDASAIIAPPYDVISAELQSKLHERHPNNAIRLVLPDPAKTHPKGKDEYDSAKLYFEDWINTGVLKQDQEGSYYLVSEDFKYRGAWTRWGLLAAVKLEEYDAKIILPHESTLDGPKKEQYSLLETCEANLSPVFSCYFDPENDIIGSLRESAAKTPDLEAEEHDGVIVRMWKISGKKVVNHVREAFEDKPLYIADGHHRYETCLAYKRRMLERHPNETEAPWNRTLMYLCEFNDPALAIMPYHRAIRHLKGMNPHEFIRALEVLFNIKRIELNPWRGGEETRTKAANLLSEAGREGPAFELVMTEDNNVYLLTPKKEAMRLLDDFPDALRSLDIVVLHRLAFEEVLEIHEEDLRAGKVILYDTDYRAIWQAIRKKGWAAAFFINPIKPEQVKNVAEAGLIMPQKSTYFYPKITSGLVFHRFI